MKNDILQYLKKYEEKQIYYDNKDNQLAFIICNKKYYKTSFTNEKFRMFEVNNLLHFRIQTDDKLKKYCHVILFERFKMIYDCYLSSQNTFYLLNKYAISQNYG